MSVCHTLVFSLLLCNSFRVVFRIRLQQTSRNENSSHPTVRIQHPERALGLGQGIDSVIVLPIILFLCVYII